MALDPAQQNHATIGIFPQIAAPKPVTLVIPEATHNYSGAEFTVTDTDGLVVCNVSGKSLSYTGQKVFTDVQGQPLFTLKKKSLSLLGSHEGVGPDGSTLFEIDGKWTFASVKMSAKFTNKADGSSTEISIKGDWKKRDAQMVHIGTGSILATLSGEHASMWKLFKPADKDYFVHVAPGVDLALIAALAIAFDECQLEKRQPIVVT